MVGFVLWLSRTEGRGYFSEMYANTQKNLVLCCYRGRVQHAHQITSQFFPGSWSSSLGQRFKVRVKSRQTENKSEITLLKKYSIEVSGKGTQVWYSNTAGRLLTHLPAQLEAHSLQSSHCLHAYRFPVLCEASCCISEHHYSTGGRVPLF